MGIGNTTPSAAVIAAITGRTAAEVTGRGTGVDDATLARKVAVRRAPAWPVSTPAGPAAGPRRLTSRPRSAGSRSSPSPASSPGPPRRASRWWSTASSRWPARCLAAAIAPDVLGYCVAGHRSTEPGASAALEHLGLRAAPRPRPPPRRGDRRLPGLAAAGGGRTGAVGHGDVRLRRCHRQDLSPDATPGAARPGGSPRRARSAGGVRPDPPAACVGAG